MNWERSSHTATFLPGGKVLVVGGYGASAINVAPSASETAELYDPATRRWLNTAPMRTPRYHHTATLLSNGMVLVAGGSYGQTRVLDSAELYSPRTGRWQNAGHMGAFRMDHTATLLRSGQVLVVGGLGGISGTRALGSAELFDPVTGIWHPTGHLITPRANHTATLLRDGRVLVVGGLTGSGKITARAELYDPATGRWKSIKPLRTARYNHTATLLRSGEVLVAGGGTGRPSTSAELYSPTTGRWLPADHLRIARRNHEAVLLPNGTVLVAGGYGGHDGSLASAEIFG